LFFAQLHIVVEKLLINMLPEWESNLFVARDNRVAVQSGIVDTETLFVVRKFALS